MFYEVLKLLFYFLLIIAFFYVVYKATVFYAGHSMNYQNSKYMKLIDRLSLSKDFSINIIQVGDHYFLMSTNNGKSELLKELTKDDLIEFKAQSHVVPNFYESIQKGILKAFNKISKKNTDVEKEYRNRERASTIEFSEFLGDKINNGGFYKKSKDDSVVDELLKDSENQAMKFKKRIYVDEGELTNENK